MGGERWITEAEAAAIVRKRLGGSIGRSEAIVKEVLASGEIRRIDPYDPVLLLIDDGLVGMDLRPGAKNLGRSLPPWRLSTMSQDDFVDYLDRHHTPPARTQQSKHRRKQHRYAGDAALIKEGRRMIARGMTKSRAAVELASRAEGGTVDQKKNRLRRFNDHRCFDFIESLAKLLWL